MLKRIGDAGEKAAVRYLRKQGCKILEKNFRAVRGEIDIIARDGDTLVFVEVKTNSEPGTIAPEFRVNQAKQQQIGKIAQAYLNSNFEVLPDCRFDVIGVTLQESRSPEISHIRNAFWL